MLFRECRQRGPRGCTRSGEESRNQELGRWKFERGEEENRGKGSESSSLNGISTVLALLGMFRGSPMLGPCARGRICGSESGGGISPSWASNAACRAECPRAASSHRKPQLQAHPACRELRPLPARSGEAHVGSSRPLRGCVRTTGAGVACERPRPLPFLSGRSLGLNGFWRFLWRLLAAHAW